MRILNLIYKFSTGGIGKCFLIYAKLGNVEKNLEIVSACIDVENCNYDRSALQNINAHILKVKSRRDFSWISKVRDLIIETKPDAIFCHGFNGPIIVETVKKRYGIDVPMICSYHGKYHAPTKQKKILEGLINSTQAYLYRYYAKRIILVENFSKAYLLSKRISEEKMFVVHNGIQDITDRGEVIHLPNDTISIGLASRLDKIKGIEYLLKSLPLVEKSTSRSFHVYIIGDGPQENELHLLCSSLKITTKVTFLGYRNNVRDWLEAMDIFALPSLHEYHSIALLEAMRSGKAIVATKVGGNEESVTNEKEALTIPAKDIYALSEALIRLIEDDKLRERLGSNARNRYLQEFTETAMMHNLVKALTL